MRLIRFPLRPRPRKAIAPAPSKPTNAPGLTITLDADKILAALARLRNARKDHR